MQTTEVFDIDDIVPIGFPETPDRDTGERLDYDDSEELFVCANCEGEFTEDQLEPSVNLAERFAPGEIVPHGDCPDCGAFCYPQNSDEFDESDFEGSYPLDSFDDGEALASAGWGTDEDYGDYGCDEY